MTILSTEKPDKTQTIPTESKQGERVIDTTFQLCFLLELVHFGSLGLGRPRGSEPKFEARRGDLVQTLVGNPQVNYTKNEVNSGV